ncbi:hypothetical protein FRC06_005263, partial [Ceratobasidium sp. 370]
MPARVDGPSQPRAVPAPDGARGAQHFNEAELQLQVELGFASTAALAPRVSRSDAIHPATHCASPSPAGPSSRGNGSTWGETTLQLGHHPSAQCQSAIVALPPAPQGTDSPKTWQRKVDALTALQRGTTSPVRVSVKRKRDAANGHTDDGGDAPKLSSNPAQAAARAATTLGTSLRTIALTSSSSQRPDVSRDHSHAAQLTATAASTGPLATSSSTGGANADPPQPLSQDHGQHKRTGFQKWSSKLPAAQAPNRKQTAQTLALDSRDTQIDKSTSGPHSPSCAAKTLVPQAHIG